MDAMSCFAQPPPAQFLSASSSPGPAAYYADAAIARALHFTSMPMLTPEYDYDYAAAAAAAASSPSSASAASSSSFFADFPCDVGGGSSSWFASAPAPATGPFACDSVLVASDVAAPRPPSTPVAARRRFAGLGPNAGAGRPGKRRARASKRAPTTYISTDPANFRLMVQHVTGVQAEPNAAADGSSVMHASFDASSAATAALLGGHTFDGADAAALHRHQVQQVQQQPCFPTLDSWSVMYESSQQLQQQ